MESRVFIRIDGGLEKSMEALMLYIFSVKRVRDVSTIIEIIVVRTFISDMKFFQGWQ